MQKKIAIAGACLVVAAIALYLTFFRASDEDKIKKCLSELAKTVEVKEGDTIISRTSRMRTKFKDFVDDDVTVNVEELNIDVRGRKKLEDDAAKAGLMYSAANVEFVSTKLKLDAGGIVATVDTTAVVTATKGGERQADKRDVHLLLRKDGDWKITSIDVMRPSQQPSP
jgi:hypothetical protein